MGEGRLRGPPLSLFGVSYPPDLQHKFQTEVLVILYLSVIVWSRVRSPSRVLHILFCPSSSSHATVQLQLRFKLPTVEPSFTQSGDT
jgi:hypothetical protein